MLRFLYLNIYSFVPIFAGALVLLLPFYKINKYIFIVQIIITFCLFILAAKLFCAWEDKKKKRQVLLGKNRDVFRPDTFEVFMQAPCGRLIVQSVLSELCKSGEYKNLLKFKKPVLVAIKENFKPVKTVVYINEDALIKS